MKYMAPPGAPPAAWQGPCSTNIKSRRIQQPASYTEIQTLPTPVALEVTGAKLLALSYSAGEMFWGHSVCVTSFDGLTLTDTNVELQG
jgi:hypothetical protein